MATDGPKDVLSRHVAPGESVEAAERMEDRVVAVTDRRIVEIEQSSSGRRPSQEVESLFLNEDHLDRVNVDYTGKEPPARGRVILFGLFAVVGTLFGFLALASEGATTVLIGGIAVIFLVLGLIVLLTALNTRDGSINVTVTLGDDVSESFHLPEDATEVADAASRVAATRMSDP